MEVIPGYKPSNFGPIPEDWDVKPIASEIDLLTGFPFPSNEYSKSGTKLLRGSNVKRGATDWTEDITQYWSRITSDIKPYLLEEGDIVVAMDGSLVGRSFARLKLSDIPALLLQRVARIRSDSVDMGYLKEFICSDYFTKHCDSVKTSSAIPHISPSDIKSFTIPIPKKRQEQTAIAKALSDADALISSLENLIVKKRNIKQGAMQQLLQPKDEWETKRLGDVATLKARIGWQGLTTEEYLKSGEYFLVTGTDFKNGYIDWDHCHYVDYNRYKQDRYIQLKENDILVTKDGTIGKVAFINKIIKPATLNSGVFVIRPLDKSFYQEYFYYILMSEHFSKFLAQLAAGSTISHLYQKDFVHYTFPVPKSFQEQIRIASVLSDMDSEITFLGKKLEKYKQIKQAMMQNLLTGKIRLV